VPETESLDPAGREFGTTLMNALQRNAMPAAAFLANDSIGVGCGKRS
jgi:hypothetical protein